MNFINENKIQQVFLDFLELKSKFFFSFENLSYFYKDSEISIIKSNQSIFSVIIIISDKTKKSEEVIKNK